MSDRGGLFDKPASVATVLHQAREFSVGKTAWVFVVRSNRSFQSIGHHAKKFSPANLLAMDRSPDPCRSRRRL